jgi:hypothetical protein
MPPIDQFLRWLRTADDFESWIERQPKPPVRFDRIQDVDSPPTNDAIKETHFYVVSRQGKHRWALFSCPCGCKSVVTLSLQRVHHPHWRVRRSTERRPTLRPSVWRDVGCMSHFFVHDGRIYWCGDTGSSPWEHRRPDSSTERNK